MMNAEKIREITNKVNTAKRNNRVNECAVYAAHLIDTKITKAAHKGQTCTELKIRKKYSASLTANELRDRGFTVGQKTKNRTQILTVKW